MEELSKTPHLYIRSGKFYFRIRVPKELVNYLGKKEIKKSLKTSSRIDAKIQVSLEKVKADELFATARRALYSQEYTVAPPSVSEAELDRVALLWFQQQKLEFEKLDLNNRFILSEQQQIDFADSLIDELAALESNEESIYSHILKPVSKKVLASHNISIEDDQIKNNHFNLLIHRGSVQLTHNRLSNYGYSNTAPKDLFYTKPLPPTIEPTTQIATHTWGEIIERFVAAKTSDDLTKKSLTSYKLISDFSIEFFGKSRDVCSITTSDCRSLKDKISHLPSNATKRHPSLSLLEAADLYSKSHSNCLSSTSINNQIRNLSTIFNFAFKEGLIARNPASAIKRVKAKKTDGPSRRSFKVAELNKIFKAPLYTGCIDDKNNFNKIGNNLPRGIRFWIPLISLFTGMRLRECCQLFSDDIGIEDGVPVIYIREDDTGFKKLKNNQSERTVPIHPILENIGFIDFANRAKNDSQKMLFKEIQANGSGSYSDNASKWFSRFLDQLDLRHSGLVFHSFRHTFRDAARDNDLNKEAVASIGGWTYSNDVMDKYGQGYRIQRLYEEINKIKYDGLDLKHLYRI